jgi:tetratricopeptide (TPR) repeat protein
MTHRWLTLCVVMAFGLSSGCGCQSRTIDGGDEGAVPGAGPATAGTTPAPGPATGPAGPNITGGQDTGAGPAIPTGDQAVDPTPKSYIAVIEALAPPLEKSTLEKLAADLDAKLKANGKDPVAWCARAAIAAREALHATSRANPDPDLKEFTAAVERAATHAGDGQWKYLVEHQLASKARLAGDMQGAVDRLKAAIKLQPAFVLGHVEYFQLMVLAGQRDAAKLDQAQAKLQTLVKRWPGEWQGWFTLARCQIVLRKLPPAKSSLDEALKLRPDMLVLHESMMQIESLIFRERKDVASEEAVRARFGLMGEAAKKHFKEEPNLKRHQRQMELRREQFEESRAAILVIDFDLLPAERRTHESIFGRLKRPNARGQMVRALAAGLAESEKAQDRICVLLTVVRKDASDLVRVAALRGLHQNLGGRAPRPWKRGERKRFAPMCQDDLAILLTELDPEKDHAVLLRVEEALGKLPASKICCVPELVDGRAKVQAEAYLPLLDQALTEQAKPAKERDKEALDKLLKQLDPLLEELQVIDGALKEIWGLGAPASPDWETPGDVKRWMAAWAAHAAEVQASRTEQNFKHAPKCK